MTYIGCKDCKVRWDRVPGREAEPDGGWVGYWVDYCPRHAGPDGEGQ